MSKNKLELISFTTSDMDNQIYISSEEDLKKIRDNITYIALNLEWIYVALRNNIIYFFKNYNQQNVNTIDMIRLFEKMYDQKDNIIDFEKHFDYWYEDNCFVSKEGFIAIENINPFLNGIYNFIKDIIVKNENIKDILKNIDIELYIALETDLKNSYIPTIEDLNRYIKEINKLIKSFNEYAIRVEED